MSTMCKSINVVRFSSKNKLTNDPKALMRYMHLTFELRNGCYFCTKKRNVNDDMKETGKFLRCSG